jgi:hypothetical protein
VFATGAHPHNKVSHSNIEKQRRDRINALIDQLRDLLSPTGPAAAPTTSGSAASDAGKKPKHQVLLETIMLVKHLQNQVGVVTKLLAYAQANGHRTVNGSARLSHVIKLGNLLASKHTERTCAAILLLG